MLKACEKWFSKGKLANYCGCNKSSNFNDCCLPLPQTPHMRVYERHAYSTFNRHGNNTLQTFAISQINFIFQLRRIKNKCIVQHKYLLLSKFTKD